MKEFMYFTSGVTYRVEIKEDGSLGQPEVLKKWTSETYAPKKKTTKKEVVVEEPKAQQGAVEW